MIRSLLTTSLLLIVATGLGAQEPEGDAPRRQPGAQGLLPQKSDLRLVYYKPRHPRADFQVLHRAAFDAFGRKVTYREAGGTLRSVRNIFPVGASIAIYDEKDEVENILQRLPRMEEAAFGPAPKRPERIETSIIILKYIESEAALLGLQAYSRLVPSPNRGEGSSMSRNIIEIPHRNAILLNETAENTERIRRVLAMLDTEMKAGPSSIRPITLQVWVILAQGDSGKASDIPSDLAQNLAELVPYPSFRSLGTGLVRSRAGGDRIVLEMGLGEDGNAKFLVRRISLQDDDREIGLEEVHCSVRLTDKGGRGSAQNISTSTTIRAGEYTVLGAAGRTPVFFVIRPVVGR